MLSFNFTEEKGEESQVQKWMLKIINFNHELPQTSDQKVSFLFVFIFLSLSFKSMQTLSLYERVLIS